MPKLAANLSMLFTEAPFVERFDLAANCGFQAVEFLFPYDFAADQLAEIRATAGVTVALFNLSPGDWAAGERGLAALPGREADFEAALDQALFYAEALGADRLHVMAGLVPGDDALAGRTYRRNLVLAAARAAEVGRQITIEPLNSRDVPGYFLTTSDQAAAIIRELDLPNLRLQFDLYHAQIMEGDVMRRIEALLPMIGHMQIAGVPDRHEPDSGEVAFDRVLPWLDEIGYQGWIGCEYRPRQTTLGGLGWALPYGIKAA